MRKSDKKIDKAISQALTHVCDLALEQFDGFQWLTHVVNYRYFPNSLSIVCIFDTNAQLAEFLTKRQDKEFYALIGWHMAKSNISIKNISRHVRFDTEEDCAKENNGQWPERLK